MTARKVSPVSLMLVSRVSSKRTGIFVPALNVEYRGCGGAGAGAGSGAGEGEGVAVASGLGAEAGGGVGSGLGGVLTVLVVDLGASLSGATDS